MKAKLTFALISLLIGSTATAGFLTLRSGATIQLCPEEGKGDPNLTTVIIKIKQKNSALTAMPQRCEVYPGTTIIWNADSNTETVWARFGTDVSGPTNGDESADANNGFLFQGKKSSAGALPFDIQTRKDRPGEYKYFLSINGSTWQPNPAIIIKPDRRESIK